MERSQKVFTDLIIINNVLSCLSSMKITVQQFNTEELLSFSFNPQSKFFLPGCEKVWLRVFFPGFSSSLKRNLKMWESGLQAKGCFRVLIRSAVSLRERKNIKNQLNKRMNFQNFFFCLLETVLSGFSCRMRKKFVLSSQLCLIFNGFRSWTENSITFNCFDCL